MNAQFVFDNIFYFPAITAIVIAIYLIQFCSVISPCYIEFDEDSSKEMRLMNRYNILSQKAFSIHTGSVLAGIFVSLVMGSTLTLIVLMVLQLVYLVCACFVMFAMYDRSKMYWENKASRDNFEKTLTLSNVN